MSAADGDGLDEETLEKIVSRRWQEITDGDLTPRQAEQRRLAAQLRHVIAANPGDTLTAEAEGIFVSVPGERMEELRARRDG